MQKVVIGLMAVVVLLAGAPMAEAAYTYKVDCRHKKQNVGGTDKCIVRMLTQEETPDPVPVGQVLFREKGCRHFIVKLEDRDDSFTIVNKAKGILPRFSDKIFGRTDAYTETGFSVMWDGSRKHKIYGDAVAVNLTAEEAATKYLEYCPIPKKD